MCAGCVCVYMLANLCRCLHLGVGGWLHLCTPKCAIVCVYPCVCAICRFFSILYISMPDSCSYMKEQHGAMQINARVRLNSDQCHPPLTNCLTGCVNRNSNI